MKKLLVISVSTMLMLAAAELTLVLALLRVAISALSLALPSEASQVDGVAMTLVHWLVWLAVLW